MNELLDNRILWAVITATIMAQVLKFVVSGLLRKRWDWARLLGGGGMPSGHAAAVTALAFGVGLHGGFSSPVFAVAATLAYIVMYDAANVRRAVGLHAERLNAIAEHSPSPSAIPERLKTMLGHTYLEVFAGFVLGLLVSILIVQ